MDARKIDDSITVAYQILPGDVPAIAAQGFKAIICNRPDNEDEGQPSADEIRAAAAASGLAFHHIPTVSGQFPDDVVAAFREAVDEAGGPVFAYCRTGTRCANLNALASAGSKPADEIISAAATAGYDLSALRPRIEAR